MIELLYNDDGGEHDDVVLRFGDADTGCSDSYWHARDNGVRPGDRSPAKVRLVLAELLRQWEQDVAKLEVGGTAWLPWDFSDQYTEWIRVEQEASNRLALTRVWTEAITGTFLLATGYGPDVPEVSSFTESYDSPRLQVARDDLLAAIRRNRAHLEAG